MPARPKDIPATIPADCVYLSNIRALPIADNRRMLTVAEFCRRFSIGNTTAYAEVKAGHLRFRKVGSRRLIRMDDAEGWSLSKRQPLPSPSTQSPRPARDHA